MAINKIDWPTPSTPSYTPSISEDYNAQNENIERLARGFNSVSLTNWDSSTTAPQVAAGSIIESNGVFYDVTSDTPIDTTSATSGIVYLAFDDTAGSEGFYWSDTSPSFSDTLRGWYISGDRFTRHICDWDGSTAFNSKAAYLTDRKDGDIKRIGPDNHIAGTTTIGAAYNKLSAFVDTIGFSLPVIAPRYFGGLLVVYVRVARISSTQLQLQGTSSAGAGTSITNLDAGVAASITIEMSW